MVYTCSMNIPRLKPGQGIKGPEFYGCSNTGLAPSLLRSRLAGRYLVGPELYIAGPKIVVEIATNPRKRIFHFQGKTVYAYRTRSSAVAKFNYLCEKANETNKRMAAEHTALKERAENGDMQAVLDLANF